MTAIFLLVFSLTGIGVSTAVKDGGAAALSAGEEVRIGVEFGSGVIIEIDEDDYDDVTDEVVIDIETLPEPDVTAKTVLVYHTHTTEAYFPEDGSTADTGVRSSDNSRNIVAVGDVLAQDLTQLTGLQVIHDTTPHEAEVFSQSYDRSLATMLEYDAQYRDVCLYIDVHRDSIDDTAYAQNDVVQMDGKSYARLMFVVGTGQGQSDGEFSDIPDWESNYALAQRITDELNAIVPGIAKDVMVKKGRYNQHVSDQCLLVEMGYSANTLTQAKNSAGILAQAIASVIS